MLTAEQKAERMQGIGGSDAATVLGFNPYKTPYELWAEKTGKVEPDDLSDQKNIIFGHALEPVIAVMYQEETGNKVRRNNKTLTNDKYPLLIGHIDRDVVGQKKLLEIKNVGWRMKEYWGQPGTDEVASYYLPQVHVYMMLLDYESADVAAYFGGDDLAIYTVERNERFNTVMYDKIHDFWNDYVVSDVAPPMDYGQRSTTEFLKRLYPDVEDVEVDLSTDLFYWHKVKLDAQNQVKKYQAVVDGCTNRIRQAMETANFGRFPDGSGYTRKVVKRRGFTVEPSEYVKLTFKKGE